MVNGGILRQYELMMMLDPEVDEDRVSAIVERVKSFVSERGGEFAEGNHWGKRKLAYKIGSLTEANYLLANLEMDPEPAKELEGTLKMTEEIVRHMLLRHDVSDEDEEQK